MTEDHDNPFHRFKSAEGSLEFSIETIERLETVGRLMVERWRREAGADPGAPTPQHPFPLGTLVKPRDFAPLRHRGAYVVMECLDAPIRYEPSGRDLEGFLFDLRVGGVCPEGHVHTWLAESWMFEPYTGIVLFGAKPAPGIV